MWPVCVCVCVKTLRVVLQEVLACGVLLPLINQLSDPDYINQFVIWMVSVGAHSCRLSLKKRCGRTDVDTFRADSGLQL